MATLKKLTVSGGAVSATLLGYSAPTVPRCCPDLRRPVEWRWRDGKFAEMARLIATLV